MLQTRPDRTRCRSLRPGSAARTAAAGATAPPGARPQTADPASRLRCARWRRAGVSAWPCAPRGRFFARWEPSLAPTQLCLRASPNHLRLPPLPADAPRRPSQHSDAACASVQHGPCCDSPRRQSPARGSLLHISPSILAPMLGFDVYVLATHAFSHTRRPGHSRQRPRRAVPGRGVRCRAAPAAALVHPRATRRRARQPARRPRTGLLRAARPLGRDSMRGLAEGLGLDPRARGRSSARRGDAGGDRGRLRLLPRQRHLIAQLLVLRNRPARGRGGRPARADRPPAQGARRRGAARAPTAPAHAAASPHDRRDHGRERQGAR